ncbi:hypothetical protein BKG82_24590 [Mycobacteroides chelonae]|uniref:ADP-ribosylglycohydrolase n=1 Tax=Mycobacteroides chelonae TaxID=1774 RepID=A0A1S1LMH1_MYCCH|nr:hypothetical protein AOT87_17355 [Mycobacteroides sp. H003]KRQ35491.1 hypothetical protein AOT91_04670 [Mycobacteroides sp. H092]KRQ37231.1 hypothetical protein AOT92_21420 [Mycobacteroides sp. H101]KRQ43891.1 hypothetical protein AOT88_22680 [Mycobacteroides sp. H063]KRQ61282.1 hypothetical protein AOT90_18055 [Mycobacteroides sp. H079]KRQ62025.1 hypothetical protein AOT94_03855 [Mycobacteroides sp. HXVII]KRQ68806.1 hypothetical protein AOT89_13545 [Mycobacteroides sp. H070]KRQ77534.1 hy
MNHSGDSDSAGSITVNLLGAMWGAPSLPPDWLDRLELREVIATVADDLRRPAGPRSDERYPAR